MAENPSTLAVSKIPHPPNADREAPDDMNHQSWQPTPCRLQDLGNYVTEMLEHLSDLADTAINSKETEQYAIHRIQQAKDAHKLADLGTITYLAEKTKSLK
jgi:hypothetical protein